MPTSSTPRRSVTAPESSDRRITRYPVTADNAASVTIGSFVSCAYTLESR